jgi:uncharacterized protein
MRALLDVNVLIAMLDADHVHHGRAREWFKAEATGGWASCPITQNGCVRIMSQPAYPNPLRPSAVIERLARASQHPLHEFWPADISLLHGQALDPHRLHGPRQVTDAYLLALAVHHGGRLVTFDESVPLSAVPGASAAYLTVL